jgi:hypothetical protein
MTTRNTIRLALAVAALLSGASCHPAGGANSSAAASSGAPASAAPPTAQQAPAPATFQVAVTLSPKAAASIAQSQVSVDVMVTFYGDPSDQRLEDQYQGQYPLAPEEDVVMTGAGTATIAIPQIDPAKAASMRSGAQYEVTVVSGNHVTQNNTLDCNVPLDQPLATVAGKTIAVNCKLIGES